MGVFSTMVSLENPYYPHINKIADKYAVIEVGGTQQIVQEGRYYICNRLQAETGSKIRFGRVLAIKKDGEILVGAPWLPKGVVEANVLNELKNDKIIVYKMKPKKHTRSKNGHRQWMSRFFVTKITVD